MIKRVTHVHLGSIRASIAQTSFLEWTFLAVSYSKPALAIYPILFYYNAMALTRVMAKKNKGHFCKIKCFENRSDLKMSVMKASVHA